MPHCSIPSPSSSQLPCEFCEVSGHVQANCSLFIAARASACKRRRRKPAPKRSKSLQLDLSDFAAPERAGSAGLRSSDVHTPLLVDAEHDWNADTGATSHMTPHRHWFRTYTPLRVPIKLADSTVIYSAGVGSVVFNPRISGKSADPVEFSRVLHVPDLRSNLLSVLFLTRRRNFIVRITARSMEFLVDSKVLFVASINDDHAAFLDGETQACTEFAKLASTLPLDLALWHRRLAHHNIADVQKLVREKLVDGLTLKSSQKPDPICEPCLAGKMHANPFPSSDFRASAPLELVHSDVHGPLPVKSMSGHQYWVTFIDDCSRYRCVYPMKRKSDVFEAFQSYKAWAENQLNRKIKVFRDDKGGEYISNAFNKFMDQAGIVRQHTMRNRPQQNGVAENANRVLSDRLTAMLAESNLPPSFWAEGLHALTHVWNRCPTAAVEGAVPYTRWCNRKPSVDHLRVWGCTAYVHVQRDKRKGLGWHMEKCVFIGYPDGYKGWRFYNPTTKRIVLSERADFDERYFPGLKRPATNAPAPPAVPAAPAPAAAHPPVVEHEAFVPGGDSDDDDDPAPWAAPLTRNSAVGAPPPRPATPQTPQPPTPRPPLPPRSPARPSPPPKSESPPSTPFHPNTRSAPSAPPRPGPAQAGPSRAKLKPPGEWWRIPAPKLMISTPPKTPEWTMHRDPTPHFDAEEPDEPDKPDAPSSDDELELMDATAESIDPNPGSHIQQPADLTGDDSLNMFEVDFASAEFSALKAGLYVHPRSYKDAMKRSDSAQWHAASLEEMKAHWANGTWEIVKLPAGAKAIPSGWVYLIKKRADGSIERYKGRLVAKGYGQRPGLDYIELYAPTLRDASLRLALSLAAIEDLHLHSVDISTAFLNATLQEEIYMRQPEGFHQGGPDDVCRLRKSIYGLKQAPREWNKKLHATLATMGFKRLESDHSLYVYQRGEVRIILPVFVDDITLASRSQPSIDSTIAELETHFKLRNLGPTTQLLGMEITRDRSKRELRISQKQYIVDLLARFNMTDCNPVSTPLDPGCKLSVEDCPTTSEEYAQVRGFPYLSAVGGINYLAQKSRPDLVHSAGLVVRFSSNPGPKHIAAVKHILRYIKGTMDLQLVYRPTASKEFFTTYSDSDHAGCKDSGHSTGGYCVRIGSGAVSWSSKRQTIAALSTTEAEYIAAVEAGKEIFWMRNILGELGYSFSAPSVLRMDNNSAISVAKNPEHHGRMKHLDLKFFWLRDAVEAGTIAPLYVSTQEQVADIFTKPLPRQKFQWCRKQLGVE